jgi:hypothetical protein
VGRGPAEPGLRGEKRCGPRNFAELHAVLSASRMAEVREKQTFLTPAGLQLEPEPGGSMRLWTLPVAGPITLLAKVFERLLGHVHCPFGKPAIRRGAAWNGISIDRSARLWSWAWS